MEIHPRCPGASALIDAANDGLLLASSRTGTSGSVIAVFSSLILIAHRRSPHHPAFTASSNQVAKRSCRSNAPSAQRFRRTDVAHHHCRNVRSPRQLTMGHEE
jgi:hypothetical protein